MTDERQYPYDEGDTIVLGPEIFASKDREVICWQGENYALQSRTMSARESAYGRGVEGAPLDV